MITINKEYIIETKPYKGIAIFKEWYSSNFIGTVTHYAELPNGKIITSPIRKHITKRINKYFNDKDYRDGR